MTFISFAQNCEDVLLNRAFGSLNDGFYIDVGAGDPEFNSVTKSFYDRGWHGINVEPLLRFHHRLILERPRDTNLAVATSDSAGHATLFRIEGHEELSTVVSEIARGYSDAGRGVTEIETVSRTLVDICEEFAREPIHFLKVDTEGAELATLAGADFEKFRPWVVVVESVTFGADSPDHPDWERILIEARYRYVYFDGLNRFYVAEEHSDLTRHFETPVNVRDQYSRPSEGRSVLMLNRIAVALGIESYSDEHEVFERTHALLKDRVDFEHRATALQLDVEQLQMTLRALQTSHDSLSSELEARWQQSFERERYIAWQASDLQRERGNAALALGALESIKRTRSWRLSLPVRVIRHPRTYVRKLLGR